MIGVSMAAPYRLYGADLSPYSNKVLSVLGFKGVEHQYVQRTPDRRSEFDRFGKLPILPILVGADDFVLQETTQILEVLERRYPEPSIAPSDPALAFLAFFLEDYADEWVNKLLHHYRWRNEADALSAAKRIGQTLTQGLDGVDSAEVEALVRERMTSKLAMIGCTPENAAVLEASYARLLEGLETHLKARSYLFGARPCLADFALSAQLAQLVSDPTGGALCRTRAPSVGAWLSRMEAPVREGDLESLEALAPTLRPLLEHEVAACALAWLQANAKAASMGEKVEVALPGGSFGHVPQRSAANAFVELRRKRAAVAGAPGLGVLLESAGCDRWLEPPTFEAPSDVGEAREAVFDADAAQERETLDARQSSVDVQPETTISPPISEQD
jgi:glutathione S-transferase